MEGMFFAGFRNSSNPQATEDDQPLTSAARGKIEQEIRKSSASSRNQESDEEGDW